MPALSVRPAVRTGVEGPTFPNRRRPRTVDRALEERGRGGGILSRIVRPIGVVALAIALVAGGLTVGGIAGGGMADAATPGSAADAAAAYLATLQFESGGFDAPDGFAGFLTADVAFALAQAGQTDASWDPAEALAAVQGVATNGNDALDYLDDQADGTFGPLSSGKAAQLVILVAALGLDPAAFDPQADGAVDLVAAMDAGAPSFGSIYTAPLGAIADVVLGRGVPAAVRDYIVSQQGADGSFGDAPDTTGLAIAALVAAGVAADATPVADALAYLATQHAANGGFVSFGSTSANSTAMAMLGIVAAGYDLNTSCWRDTAAPDLVAPSYVSPASYLLGLQAESGAIADPADFDAGFATAQAVQGLLTRFVPPVSAAPRDCAAVVTTTTAAAVTSTTAVVGGQATTSSLAATATTDQLPATGRASGNLAVLAMLLVVAGAGLLAGARRRTRGAA